MFEGAHGLFHGFANTLDGDYDALIGDFGARWVTADAGVQALSLRDHDASLHRLRAAARRARLKADDVAEMVCDVGEGTVHRLWEPLAAKQTPTNGYAGKFSQPYCIATGFIRGNVGLGDFTDARGAATRRCSRSPARSATASIRTIPIRGNFTGHIRATLNDGRVVEERQPHMRGGAHEPLTRADIEDKFMLNARHGGYRRRRGPRPR